MRTIYELNRRDIRAFEIFLMKKNLKVMIGGTLSFILVLFWIVSGVIQGNQQDIYTGIGAVTFIGICLCLFWVRRRKSGVYGTWEVVLNDDGVKFTPPNRNQIFVPWINLYGIYQTKTYLYLLTNSLSGFVIPKKVLSAEDALFVSIKSEYILKNVKPVAPRKLKRTLRVVFIGIIGLLMLVGILNYFSS